MKEEILKDTLSEMKKCKDPVYFYTHYLRIKNENGRWVVPPALTEEDKLYMRKVCGL